MNKSKKNNQDQLNVMRKIVENPNLSQRDLAAKLGFSLGKLNYCLKELKVKGFVKMNNFKKSENKIKYIYVLNYIKIGLKDFFKINKTKNT